MNNLYHVRGFWRGLFRQPAWHLREWLRNPAYRALHRFARQLKSFPRYTPAVVQYRGWPIHLCDGPSFLSAWDEIFVNRIYEIPVPAGKIPVLVDAGANIGLAALYWKLRYGDLCYLGFEPDPVVAACCRKNLQSWHMGGELIEAALGAEDRTATFLLEGGDAGRLAEGGVVASARIANVPVQRLATRLPETVDLLKIDVEGAEAEVLDDVAPLLDRIGAIFVEWHSRAGQPGLGRTIGQLEAAGFDCYFQVGFGPMRPFGGERSPALYTQQLNVYAVRR